MKRNPLKKAFTTIVSDRQLCAGCIGILVIIFVLIAAPAITSYAPDYFGPHRLAPPGHAEHWLGSNKLGQDIWSMIVYGTRTSIKVAIVAAFISGAIGVIVGGVSGFFGGKVDAFFAEIINVFMMIPDLFLIMLVVSMFGNSLTNVMIVIGLTTWPRNAKLMRAQALSLRERTFVKSARAMGETRLQMLMKYIIPNGIFPVIANTTMNMAYAIISEASLAFLGLGDPTVISWGQMINEGKAHMSTSPWEIMFAGLAIVVVVLVLNLAGDGLNHVLNPKHIKRGDR